MCNSQGLSCAALLGEAVPTLVLLSRIQPDSAEVQNNKKKILPLNCAVLLCQKKE